jgi:sporulation-control protein spo0M
MVFNDLKARAGFGGVAVAINLPRDDWRRDETIRGEIHLRGCNVAQEIRVLHLRLLREWSTEYYGMEPCSYPSNDTIIEAQYELRGDKGQDEELDIALAKDILIFPGEEKTFLFEIRIPKKKRAAVAREDWKLQAHADIPHAKDAIAERMIKIVVKKQREP